MLVRRTKIFNRWLGLLKDQRAVAKIIARLDRLALGNPGDSRGVGAGLVELRLDYGPGYRVYYITRGQALIVVLCAGDKKSQDDDITRAKFIAANLKEEDLSS
jgi:putative addiction module killer protein